MAVAAAAESVTSELAEHVRVVAWYGSVFIANEPLPTLRENSSAIIRCGVDMPSPINRKTYFGVAAKALSAMAREATRTELFMAPIISKTAHQYERSVFLSR